MPGDTGLTRVASDRTVARAPVATCARVAPAIAQLRRRALAKPPYSTSTFSGILTTDISGRAIWLRSWSAFSSSPREV
jgi:hypothetical protein